MLKISNYVICKTNEMKQKTLKKTVVNISLDGF